MEHPLDRFFHTSLMLGTPSRCICSASVIFQPPGQTTITPNTLIIRIVDGHLIPHVNAFIMETLAVVVASNIRRHIAGASSDNPHVMPMYTDCKGVTTLVDGTDSKHPWRKPVYNLIRAIQRDNGNVNLHWIRSHPERRHSDPINWTYLEHGNHMADTFASDSPPSRPSSTLPTLTIPATAVLQHLLLHEDWLVVTDTGLPFLGDPCLAVRTAR